MEKSNDGRAYGYAEVLDLLGGTNEALTEPYRLTDSGITFEPDPAVWRTLTAEERLAILPAGWTPGEPILAFPFSAAELLRFVEESMLPALARWCEQDENDPTAFAMLDSNPLGHGLAIFLAGGPDPTPGAQPAAAEAVATAVDPGAPPTVEPEPRRRLRRLRELGGSIRWFRGKWEIEGIGALEKAERAGGKTRCSAKTLRQDLHEAAKAEEEAKRAGGSGPSLAPEEIESNIASEHYFTAQDGATAPGEDIVNVWHDDKDCGTERVPLGLLTFCVLVLRNGFTVTGESACVSPENFDAEIGRRIARENAVAKVWPLMGYELRSKLAGSA